MQKTFGPDWPFRSRYSKLSQLCLLDHMFEVSCESGFDITDFPPDCSFPCKESVLERGTEMWDTWC